MVQYNHKEINNANKLFQQLLYVIKHQQQEHSVLQFALQVRQLQHNTMLLMMFQLQQMIQQHLRLVSR